MFLEDQMSSAALLREIETAPEEIRQEVLDFLTFLKSRKMPPSHSILFPQSVDWSDLTDHWQRIWGNEFAPGTPIEAILSDLRGDA